jgi:hypothetical protein
MDRSQLIGRALRARTEEEVSAAEHAIERWLRQNPSDSGVLAAAERLEERRAQLRDPERTSNRLSLVVFPLVSLAVAAGVVALSGSWSAGLVAGLVLGLFVSEMIFSKPHGPYA